MKQWDIIYQFDRYYVTPVPRRNMVRLVAGYALLAIGLGGILGPFMPALRLEAGYHLTPKTEPEVLPAAVPVVFEPLTTPDGVPITAINENFALIVPKIGINAPVASNVDPAKPDEYGQTLQASVAHASTSFFPDEDGTVYLFSHSTNYDWFVDDLNAVFYLLKNLNTGDTVVLMYNHKRYTYKITDKKVVSPTSTSYLYPHVGTRNLILQTCWPPGSTSQRLLIFADLLEENGKQI